MSILKVNTILDKGGNTLLSSDGAGTISSGGAITNTPAFEAYLSADQSVANNTNTKINFNIERFDTNSAYDTSTYKFTVPTAGKYYIYARYKLDGATNGTTTDIKLYKNGSQFLHNSNVGYNGVKTMSIETTVNCAVSDYFEIYMYQNGGSTYNLESDASNNSATLFGAYKLIGA